MRNIREVQETFIRCADNTVLVGEDDCVDAFLIKRRQIFTQFICDAQTIFGWLDPAQKQPLTRSAENRWRY